MVFVLIIGLALADKPSPTYKGSVSSVNKKPETKTVEIKSSLPVAKKVVPQKKAQERSDTYGSPSAPVQDEYGSPQAPVQDSYGSPQAAPETYSPPAPPVQGEVGTQGYYYPVSNSYGGSGSAHKPSYSPSHSSSSGGGGLLGGGGGLGLLLLLGLGALVVFGVIAIAFSNNNNNNGRDLFGSWSADDLAYFVYNAIDMYNEMQ